VLGGQADNPCFIDTAVPGQVVQKFDGETEFCILKPFFQPGIIMIEMTVVP